MTWIDVEKTPQSLEVDSLYLVTNDTQSPLIDEKIRFGLAVWSGTDWVITDGVDCMSSDDIDYAYLLPKHPTCDIGLS